MGCWGSQAGRRWSRSSVAGLLQVWMTPTRAGKRGGMEDLAPQWGSAVFLGFQGLRVPLPQGLLEPVPVSLWSNLQQVVATCPGLLSAIKRSREWRLCWTWVSTTSPVWQMWLMAFGTWRDTGEGGAAAGAQLPFPSLSAASGWLLVPETSGFGRDGGRQEANMAGQPRHRPITSIRHQSGSLPVTSSMPRATC